VTFDEQVTLHGGGSVVITGATQVIFKKGLVLDGADGLGNAGDIFLEGDEIDFQAAPARCSAVAC